MTGCNVDRGYGDGGAVVSVSRHESGSEVYRITTARSSLSEDIRGRQRRYVITMVIRTISVILTVVLWQISRPAAFATLVAGLLLPYIAVVVANAGRENAPGTPDTFVGPQTPPMVGGAPPSEDSEEHGRENPPVP